VVIKKFQRLKSPFLLSIIVALEKLKILLYRRFKIQINNGG